MPRYSVGFVSRVWLEVEVIAPDRNAAEIKAQRKIDKHMNEEGVTWLDGRNEVCSTTNCSLLRKVPD